MKNGWRTAAKTALGVLAILAASAPRQASAQACAFPSSPAVLFSEGDAHAKGGMLLQRWELPQSPLWSSAADPDGYHGFRDRVAKSAAETDPLRLLAQTQSRNNSLVAASASDWIKPATCLQKLLQQTQDRRIDTFASPTEFASAVLRSADGEQLRVYFYTVNQDGMGRMTPLTDPVAADAAQGWKVLAVLHNHNFHPGQPAINGALAPSLPDAQFVARLDKRVGVEEAWITNGLHTSQIPASAFDRFEQPE